MTDISEELLQHVHGNVSEKYIATKLKIHQKSLNIDWNSIKGLHSKMTIFRRSTRSIFVY